LQRLRLSLFGFRSVPRVAHEDGKFIKLIENTEKMKRILAKFGAPTHEMLQIAVTAMKDKFGEDVELRNVVARKTLMMGRVRAQVLLDAENDLERMRINTILYRKFKGECRSSDELTPVY
jgi:hypothetical protein